VATSELDVVDSESCARVVADAAQAPDGLDILVLATGVAALGPAAGTPDAVAYELLTVNTLGPIALTRAALAELGGGGVVAVLSAVPAYALTANMAV